MLCVAMLSGFQYMIHERGVMDGWVLAYNHLDLEGKEHLCHSMSRISHMNIWGG